MIPAAATIDNPRLGSLVARTGAQAFSAATFSGVLTQEVRQESALANPLGGLTFIYQVSSNSGSVTDIARLSTYDFAGFTVDATFYSTGVQQAPDNFTRSGGVGNIAAANFGLGAIWL